jgi:hypothetical protein
MEAQTQGALAAAERAEAAERQAAGAVVVDGVKAGGVDDVDGTSAGL